MSSTIDAIDISLAQAPPHDWLPKNIRLIAHDVYKPFLEAMRGAYDVLHIQNWLCIWRDETSASLIQNLVDLLSTFTHLICYSWLILARTRRLFTVE